MSGIVRIGLVVFAAILAVIVYQQFKVPELPTLEDKWWGRGTKVDKVPLVTSIKIEVPDDIIADLKYRLHHTKPFHPSLEGVNQTYGIHTTVLNNVLNYWKNQYNWTERLHYLNKYPHFQVNIRGLRIHFLHIKPKNIIHEDGKKAKIIPLLMVHGWPGSVREFYEIIPKLTQPRGGFVFKLVIPSLPGFAWSESSPKPGLSPVYMAQIMADLMDILGYRQYYVQGGDWGSVVVHHMALHFSSKIKGIHSNMCFVNTPLSNFKFFIGKYWPSLIYEENEIELCSSPANSLKFLVEETGYLHIQATKPDTVGVALRESPIGLAAYILEKFSTLTQADFRNLEDGGLTKKFTMDQLLDNIMIYWLTDSMTSAMRIYAEAFTNFYLDIHSLNKLQIDTPAGCARFPHEILLSPKSILKQKYNNLAHLTRYETGGHFAALEEPDLLAADIFVFVEKVEKLN